MIPIPSPRQQCLRCKGPTLQPMFPGATNCAHEGPCVHIARRCPSGKDYRSPRCRNPHPNRDQWRTGYRIAVHISCPFVKSTSLKHDQQTVLILPEKIFPTSVSWNTIIHQYTKSPVEEVAFEIGSTSIVWELAMWSAAATTADYVSKSP
jgi:hypothetical protein